MSNRLDISCVIPLLDEAESLPELHAWIKRVMDANQFTYEIWFIDDGSKDNSWEIIEQLHASDPNVKGILVNIFGGIMQCDVIAEGVVSAAKETNLSIPLVVRLEGNNVEIGKKILNESGLELISGDSMADAAKKIVAVV